MLSGQWILRILYKHCFTKVWIFFIDALVVRQVSAPYNNTDLTFDLNKRTLVDVPISLEFHTFFSMLNAHRALPILVFTSASVPIQHKLSWWFSRHASKLDYNISKEDLREARDPGNSIINF